LVAHVSAPKVCLSDAMKHIQNSINMINQVKIKEKKAII
jgi:hypothetical protein